MLNTIKDTTKHVYWNSHEHCYVALMSEAPNCRAEGATPAEAIANVERAYAQDIYGGFSPNKAKPAALREHVGAGR